MDTFLAIASRRDERRYRDEPIPPDVVDRILDAGRLSGSSRNSQPWTFVVPEGRDRVDRLADAVSVPDNVRTAGLVVAITVAGRGPMAFDAGRAAQSMLLAAWNGGVAACPNGVVNEPAARAALDLPDDESLTIVLSFGLPERSRDVHGRTAEEWSARANRKPLENIVRRLP